MLTVTLKILLKPGALEFLNSESNYLFCNSTDCPVVYFNKQGQIFVTNELSAINQGIQIFGNVLTNNCFRALCLPPMQRFLVYFLH
ncbi:hypothetical protein IQ246_27830 [aff. Roholtiella sp. LEGE 12411]|nr:hypothetical protein [aff. Roholtiella sp. LEGE 12411]